MKPRHLFFNIATEKTVGELKLKSHYADELIYLTLDELRKYNLLEE